MDITFNFKNYLSLKKFINLSFKSKIIHLLVLYVIFEVLILLYKSYRFVQKHFFYKELNLIERYGENSWALITGPSSGQGKQFALQLAKRGFNIILVGSERCYKIEKLIKQLYPEIETVVIIKNFCEAHKNDFFNDIQKEVDKHDVSLLINNIGHRTAWVPYHEMDPVLIRNTISAGTIVQSRLIHMVIPKFMKRKNNKCGIINITAQCMHPNFGLGLGLSNEICVPFLSVYEASNAYGFYHANSIFKEYKDKFDLLTITPGAVITENTKYLHNTMFNIDAKFFVDNCLRLLGNYQGHTCAYWGHSFSSFMINFIPFCKDYILENVGKTIAFDYMARGKYKKY